MNAIAELAIETLRFACMVAVMGLILAQIVIWVSV